MTDRQAFLIAAVEEQRNMALTLLANARADVGEVTEKLKAAEVRIAALEAEIAAMRTPAPPPEMPAQAEMPMGTAIQIATSGAP